MGIWDFCLLSLFSFLPTCWYPIASFLKQRLSLSIELPLQSQFIHTCVCVFLNFLFYPINPVYLSLCPLPLSVGYWSFYKRLEIGQCKSSCFSKLCWLLLGQLRFPASLGISLSISTQKPAENLTEVALTLYSSWGRIDIRNKAEFSNPMNIIHLSVCSGFFNFSILLAMFHRFSEYKSCTPFFSIFNFLMLL